MIFSESFINVLTMFNKINPGMYFREGHVQTSVGVNSGKLMTFFTRAYTDVEVPEPFCIGELGKLLGVLRMFKTPPEITVDRASLVVSGEDRRITFALTDPKFISFHPSPEKVAVDDGYESVLTATNISDIHNLYGVFNAENIAFIGKDGKFQAVVSTMENPASDKGVIELGEIDANFTATILCANFRVEKTKNGGDYRLLINKTKGYVFLGSPSLEYFIPCESKYTRF